MKKMSGRSAQPLPKGIEKCPTGIRGFDEITFGGLPRGRTTLVAGGPGCGKTMFGMEFLLKGATDFGEPGVYMTFEEKPEEMADNFASLGYNLLELISQKKLMLDYVYIERNEIEETGEFDLGGIFARLDYAIQETGARRVVLDTIEALFSGLSNEGILRAELRRLFRWLKDRGMTAVVTGEKGEKSLTRHGLEEYVADCVIYLDHRVQDQITTRRVQVLKYRGSAHGTNEFPFLISDIGINVLPVTALKLDYCASRERISTGIAELDKMFSGKGFYRTSTVLITGSAGTGKSTFAAKMVEAACRRGETCLYMLFEESSDQVMRNMASVTIDLDTWVRKGLLRMAAMRVSFGGLEMHLMRMHQLIDEFQPSMIVIDPLSNFGSIGSGDEVKSMFSRLLDYAKQKGATTILTDLLDREDGARHVTSSDISSLADTWILLLNEEFGGDMLRRLRIIKSRGIRHSSEIRKFLISDNGIIL